MSVLDAFKKISLNSSASAVSISNYGLTFNKAVLERMGSPKFVDLFLDEGGKRLAIKQANSETGIPFSTSNERRVNARINNKEFARKLFELMGWEYRNVSYKVLGEWLDDEQIFVFNFMQATENVSTSKDESKQQWKKKSAIYEMAQFG